VFVMMPSVADGEALYERMGANPVHLGAGTLFGRYMRRKPYTKFPLRIHPPLHPDEAVAVLRALGGVRADKLQALKYVRDLVERERLWGTDPMFKLMDSIGRRRDALQPEHGHDLEEPDALRACDVPQITEEHPNGDSRVEESPPLIQDIEFLDFESAMRVKRALNGKTVPSGATLRVDIVRVSTTSC
jgi:hypothetical protein